MADVIKKSTNKFTKGLVMDFSPENTRNEVLTHALNATLLTFNGNELSLQNDMGNARVETAYLPEGYIPVGTCEYGGIIYIVSYNPLEDKSQIGCFPSPERNISNDELGISNALIQNSDFQDSIIPGKINNNSQCVLLKEDNLNPGDKFLVCSDGSIFNENLKDLYTKDLNNNLEPIANPILALNIVSIEDSGRIVYLNSDLRQYEVTKQIDNQDVTYSYHILGKNTSDESGFDQTSIDIDSYRNVLSSGYNVFKSKTSGKLALLAELVMIDSYSVTHSLQPKKDLDGNTIDGAFDILIHTEVSPQINTSNFITAPKLKYYYLQNSQGYLQIYDGSDTVNIPLIELGQNSNNYIYNQNFLSTKLDNVYLPTSGVTMDLNISLEDSGKFAFPFPGTYHGRTTEYKGALNNPGQNIYTKFYADMYHRISKSQIENNIDYFTKKLNAKFYYYDASGQELVEWKEEHLKNDYIYYIKETSYQYVDVCRNSQYTNETLYQLRGTLATATDAIRQDETIIKYRSVVVHDYNEVSAEDWKSGVKYYIKHGDDYISTSDSEPKDGVVYYTLTQTTTYEAVDQSEVQLNSILYYYANPKYYVASQEQLTAYWDFVTNPITSEFPWGLNFVLYRKEDTSTFRLATDEELKYKSDVLTFYYLSTYKLIPDITKWNLNNQLFIVSPGDVYVPEEYFTPDTSDNYIVGYTKPAGNYSQDGVWYDYPISLHVLNEFIPNEESNYNYDSVKLASINLPNTVIANQLDFPFKYNYTLIPCMNYGRLDHLAVSNTVDFSNLHSFNQSTFNTWKYHIDGNQLRLTFGAEVFDTYEENKVNGLILEFYDLWGFAGSLEITDKKSYSGVFTKVLQLNTKDVLSKKRIDGKGYSEAFSRNINISVEANKFMFNGDEITFTGYKNGWPLNPEDSDCGTLYSNLIYGVKAYLRQSDPEGYVFTKKNEFWLYTLPILNDHYYTVNNFNNIHNPQLDFVLTYKLSDKSNIHTYETDVIKDGYIPTELDYLNLYKNGQYKGSSLSGIRYYTYKGITNLSLEVGLKQEYQHLNLSYDPIINQFFQCSLKLVSDNDPNTTITIKPDNSLQTLNYINNDNIVLNTSLNTLQFNEGPEKTIEFGDFATYNFICNQGTKVIPITYEFVVGYSYTISDIRKTEIPMTTVCALLHKDDKGNENLDDFGLQIINMDSDSENVIYTSKAMLCNGGTKDLEVLEVVSLNTNDSSADANTQLFKRDFYEQKTIVHTRPALLNTVDPLKHVSEYIGKLTFAQPHAHMRDKDNGVNIYYDKGTDKYRISPEWSNKEAFGDLWDNTSGGDYDDTKGCVPIIDVYNYPCYNLSINTINSINQHSEFISTNDFNIIKGTYTVYDLNKKDNLDEPRTTGAVDMREFIGFKADQLCTFYKKFVNTMRGVYAYNPDYDTLPIQSGTVSVKANPITFSSNLLSKNSSFNFNENCTLNDYVCLGSMSITNYLILLKKHSVDYNGSGITTKEIINGVEGFIPQVQFTPNLSYCGKTGVPYLLANLNYNTDTPSNMISDLDIASFDKVCVKKADGSNIFITGSINKQALYGLQNNKLVQLDVSNYTISNDGNLTLKSTQDVGEADLSINIDKSNAIALISDNGYYSTKVFEDKNKIFDNSSVDIIANLNLYEGYLPNSYDPETNSIVIYATAKTFNWSKPKIQAISSDDDGYGYSVNNCLAHISGGIPACRLNSDNITLDQVKLLSASDLRTLIQGKDDDTIYVPSVSRPSVKPRAVITPNPDNEGLVIPGTSLFAAVVSSYRYGAPFTAEYAEESMQIRHKFPINRPTLYLITLNDIAFSLTRTTGVENYAASVIPVNRTEYYSKIEDHKYTVLEKYQNARIKGTSITLNDLYYDPSNKHRLYVRRHLYVYDTEIPRGKIFYRSMSDKPSWSGVTKTKASGQQYDTKNYMNYNSLYLHTGPCFTTDNLN